MDILKISATGVPLFSEKCELNFLTTQRVTDDNFNGVRCFFKNKSKTFYRNNILSLIGINASGKTTTLRLFAFVCGLLNNEPINTINHSDIFDTLPNEQSVELEIYFYLNEQVHLLCPTITRKDNRLLITKETLKTKHINSVKSKIDLFNFKNVDVCLSREMASDFLLDDTSIMVAFNKKTENKINVVDMLNYTNINKLTINEDCPTEIIRFFDPNVEYLKINNKGKDFDISLKFVGCCEIKLNQMSDINRYLSSGTIKGINVFFNAIKIFHEGGYVIIDELENHFNHEIVSTLIRFYMDEKINVGGATLIFSTHYPELLDEFERNDNVIIVRNMNGITIENLSKLLKRNDIKKSEVYQSGFLGGTTPLYEAYIDLKRSIMSNNKG